MAAEPHRRRSGRAASSSAILRRMLCLGLSLLALILLDGGRRVPVMPAQAQAPLSVVYQPGWNLIGVPAGTDLTGVQGDLLALSPDGSDYLPISADDVVGGQGYWADFAQETVVSLPTAAAGAVNLEAPPGVWLLIGNPAAEPLRLSGADVAYQYDPIGGYAPVTVLPPGRGALVYSEDGGTVTLSPAANSIIAVAPAPDTMGSLVIATSASAPSQAATVSAAETNAGSVSVVAEGFGQARPGRPIAVAALLRNDGGPTDLTPIAITVYAADGSVIAAGDTTVHYLGPGETTGLAHRLTPSGGSLAARVDVQAGTGKAAGDPPPGSLSFSGTSLSTGRSSVEASALLTSSFSNDLSEVHVNALLFDAGGSLIGGGETTKRLVPAGGSVGVVVPVEVNGSPARVEFYAQLP